MSRNLAALVYSRRVGSMLRKAVLAELADKANDDGTGIWASKATIAAEIEAGRTSVIRAIKEFVAEGLLSEEGVRPCRNGVTIVYRMNVKAVAALPAAKAEVEDDPEAAPEPHHSKPVPERNQSRQDTPPVPQRDLMACQSGTQTVLEPSLNRLADARQSASAPPFVAFWAIWPHKVGKAAAEKAWRKLKPDCRRAVLVSADGWFDRWRANNPTASPIHASTFLNQRRWEDDAPAVPPPREVPATAPRTFANPAAIED